MSKNEGATQSAKPWPPEKKNGKRIVWGIAFIAAAALIALNAAGFLSFDGVTAAGVVWAVAMVFILILSIPHLFWFGIFFPLAALLVIFEKPLGLDIQHISLWVFFGIALLLSIGFTILFHKRSRDRRNEHWNERWNEQWSYVQDGPTYAFGFGGSDAANPKESVAGNVVRVEVNFGNVIRYVNSDDLERVEAECNFGGIKLYFDNAKPQATGARIILDVNFGSAELFIPRSWVVTNDLRRSLAGFDEMNRPPTGTEKTAHVTIAGEANFSSVNVIYV
ncbi:MAG: hypothetical protein LBS67_07045 [Clostridiales Family XIII bacterium]|nr:hypothetical protein [Clostridiales Family XIII bacterium]